MSIYTNLSLTDICGRHSHIKSCTSRHAIACRAIHSTQVGIRCALSDEEILESALIRAEAFYEDDTSRFKKSFVKQFAEQEFRRLKSASSLDLVVLIASLLRPDDTDDENSANDIVGTLDIRNNYIPNEEKKFDRHPWMIGRDTVPNVEENVPPAAVYLTNVAVKPSYRGKGIGYELVRNGIEVVSRDLKASKIYVHVDAQNEVALHLYSKFGFRRVVDNGNDTEPQSLVGRKYLLQLDLNS